MTTYSNLTKAECLAKELVDRKLAACVQLDIVNSTYLWNGKVQQDNEVRLMIKTMNKNYSAIERLIQEHHSYELPEIIALPVTAGSKDYLCWVEQKSTQ